MTLQVKRQDVNVELDGYDHSLGGQASPLTVGLGIGEAHGGAAEGTIFFGPELQFGHVVGDHIEKKVLLLKYAEGGTSLYLDWRPPTAVETRPKGPQICGQDGNEFCCEQPTASGCESRTGNVGAARSKCPPLAAPQLGSCGSSGRAWRPRAARYFKGGPRPLWDPGHVLSCSS